MRKTIVMMLLAVLCSCATAKWVYLGKDFTSTTYFDSDSIGKTGNMMEMRNLIDFNTAQIDPADPRKRYLSQKAHHEFDCKEERARILDFSWHFENMGKGEVGFSGSSPGKWEPLRHGSVVEALWKVACSKQ